MDHQRTLGQLLKELRVSANLTREACSAVLNRDHLAKIEQGKQGITVGKLHALCELLGVRPSVVFYALEARLANVSLQSQRPAWQTHIDDLLVAKRLCSDVQDHASRGVRGKRAMETQEAVQKLQAQGLRKMEVVRQLSVARSTVDRYWINED